MVLSCRLPKSRMVPAQDTKPSTYGSHDCSNFIITHITLATNHQGFPIDARNEHFSLAVIMTSNVNYLGKDESLLSTKIESITFPSSVPILYLLALYSLISFCLPSINISPTPFLLKDMLPG